MKIQKLPYWLLTIVMISTLLVISCTKETISEIEQTESNLSADNPYDVEALQDMINRDLLFAQERIEKAKKLRESISKEKTINQSLTASTSNTWIVLNDGDGTTIQETVDNAADGDIILIDGSSGIPFSQCAEIVDRNSLTIRGINNATIIVGECPGLGFYDAFNVINSNSITIENLTIINSESGSGSGIFAFESTDTRIVNNQFYGESYDGTIYDKTDFYGVETYNCNTSRITKNQFFGNLEGIILNRENGSVIKKNKITNARLSGVVILFSDNNRIEDLKVQNCGFDPNIARQNTAGVVLFDSSNNLLIDVESKENVIGLAVLSFGVFPCEDNHLIRLKTKNNRFVDELGPKLGGIGITLESFGGDGVVRTLIVDSESKSNAGCDLLDRGLYTDIVNTKIGSFCN